MIDEHGLSGCRRCHGQSLTACKHVDQTAFSDIRTADKGILRFSVHIGTLVSAARGYEEFSCFNFHFSVISGNGGGYRRQSSSSAVLGQQNTPATKSMSTQYVGVRVIGAS